jgi:hypothetical protein
MARSIIEATKRLDLNDDNSVAAPPAIFPSGDHRYVSVQARKESGSWGTAVVSVQVSNTGRDWFGVPAGAVTLTAEGITDKIDVRAFGYVRAKVTTEEGGAGVASVTFCFSDLGD